MTITPDISINPLGSVMLSIPAQPGKPESPCLVISPTVCALHRSPDTVIPLNITDELVYQTLRRKTEVLILEADDADPSDNGAVYTAAVTSLPFEPEISGKCPGCALRKP